MDCAIYVVFSSTPTRMGRLIRVATGHYYNHVSLSFSQDIRKLYSFARYYRTIPLYGGFVEESILRYRSFAGDARVKICRVPVEEPRLTYLHNYFDWLWQNRAGYIYNTAGALISLLRVQASFPRTHTCVSFVQSVLARFRLAGVSDETMLSIAELERRLEEYVVYEGSAQPMIEQGEWGMDDFPQETSSRYAVYTTALHFGRLAKRMWQGVL